MDVTHALAAGMGGIRTAGDLVARMQMSRGMRLKEAKGVRRREARLHGPRPQRQLRHGADPGGEGPGPDPDHSNLHPGEPNAMMAKFRIAELLGIRINSVEKFRDLAGL